MDQAAYLLLQAFSQGLVRYGLAGGVVAASTILVAGGFAYYLKARVDSMRASEAQAVEERRSREAQRTQEILKREQERKQLMDMLEQQGKEIRTMLANHLAHDQESRDKLIETLVKTREAMGAISADLRAHREEEGRRCGQIHDYHGSIENRLTAIEVKVGLRGTN